MQAHHCLVCPNDHLTLNLRHAVVDPPKFQSSLLVLSKQLLGALRAPVEMELQPEYLYHAVQRETTAYLPFQHLLN